MAELKIDNMEYSSDLLAKEAYMSSTPTLGAGLLNHWKMNDNDATTDVVDNIGNFTGTASTTTDLLTITGKINNALNFDSTSNISLLGLSLPSIGTLCFWVKLSDIYSNNRIFGANATVAGLQIFDFYQYSGIWYCGWYNNGDDDRNTLGTVNFEADTWTHVIMQWEQDADIKIYLDNVLRATIPNMTAWWDTSTADSFYICGESSIAVLDDIRIYNKILTESERTLLYNSGAGTENDDSITPLSPSSEPIIKTQGSYSLKCIATTNSVGEYLTKNFTCINDLTNVKDLKFDMRSSRTGSNITLGLYSDTTLVTEITPNILSSNEWQAIRWNVSNITAPEKTNCNILKITIVNADAENTFYIDNFNIFPQTYDVVGVIE